MNLFWGKWPRTPIPADGSGIEADEMVSDVVDEMLRISGPDVPIGQAWCAEFTMTVLTTVDHMTTNYPINYLGQMPPFTREMSFPDMQLHNLRHLAYRKARIQATDLLMGWCTQVSMTMLVNQAEHAIILVRALRAEHMQATAPKEEAILLRAVVQECVALLSELISREPQGWTARKARQGSAPTDWIDAPWHVFIKWLVRRLPVD
jgi:hypothetical protein